MAISLMGCFAVIGALLLQTQGQEFHDRSESESPTLTFQFLGPKWQKLSFVKGNVSLYSSQGDDLFVTCQAPYPIQWNMSGIIRPADIVHISPPRRDLISKTYEITLNIFFLDAEKAPELLAASVIIACEQVNNYQVRDEMSVFVRGNNPFVEPLNKFVTDSFLIPCPTTDPTIAPQLVKLNPNGRAILVQNVEYRPTEGFYSSIIFNGIFECRKGVFSVRITANETRSRPESHFAPVEHYIRRFSDELIELECSSTTRTVHLVFNHNGTEATFVDNTAREKVAHLRRGASRPNETVITGKAACVAEGPELIKEWTFEFIEAPSLHIDNFEGELDCLSPLSPKLVQSVRCKNSMDCKFMSHCLQNTTFCNFKKQKQFYADTDTRCFIDSLGRGKDCASLPFSHLNGLAQCNVRGLTRQWEFFISLDYARYSNWKDAPTNELVRIEEVSRTSSSGGVRRFMCTSLAYLFADSLTFEIEYKNGTQKLIRGIDVANYTAQKYSKIYELSYRVVLDIEMTPDVTGINCIAPFWNSTDIVKASKCFGHSVKARMSKLYSYFTSLPHPLAVEYIDGNTEILMKRFNIGETSRKLICLANSTTTTNPVYQWHYKVGENSYLPVSEKFPEVKFTKGEIEQGILEFPEIGKQYGGEYRCSVTEGSNPGNVTSVRKYTMHVSAEPMSGNSIVFAGVVILALVIFGLIMAALAVYVSRKKTDSYKNNYNNYSNSK